MYFFQIYDEEFGHLHQTGYELVTRMPQFQSLKSSLYRQRSKAQGVQKEPMHRDEVNLAEETLCMADGTNFLLADVCEGDRLLIFASPRGKEILKQKKTLLNGRDI